MKRLLPIFLTAFLMICSCDDDRIIINDDEKGVSMVSDIGDALISGFCEDEDGSIWMCSASDGLYRYDGNSFINYYHDEDAAASLSSKFVNDIHKDSEGLIWLATQKGVDRYDPQIDGFVHYSVSESNNYVMNVIEDGDGNIYSMTKRALFKYDKDEAVFVKKIAFPNRTSMMYWIFFDWNGSLWVMYDHTIERYSRSFELMRTTDISGRIEGAIYDGRNQLLLIIDGRLKAMDVVTNEISDPQGVLKEVAGNEITSMRVLDETCLLIDTKACMYAYNPQYAELKPASELSELNLRSLSHINEYQCLYLDSGKNIWCASINGGHKVLRHNDYFYTLHSSLLSSLEDHAVTASVMNDRYVWTILDNARLMVYDVKARNVLGGMDMRTLTGTNSEFPWRMANVENGHLLFSNDGKAWLCKVGKDGFPIDPVRFSTENPAKKTVFAATMQNGIWAAGIGTDIYHAEIPQTWRSDVRLTRSDPFIDDNAVVATDAVVLENGDLMMSFSDIGLVMVNTWTKELKHILIPGVRNQIYIRRLFVDSGGDVWILSSDKGLFKYLVNDEVVISLGQFVEKDVIDMAQDRDGNIFVLCESKLYLKGAKDDYFRPLWQDMSENSGAGFLLRLPDGQVVLMSDGRFMSMNILAGTASDPLDLSFNLLFTVQRDVIKGVDFCQLSSGDARIKLNSPVSKVSMNFPVVDPLNNDIYNYYYSLNRGGDEWRTTLNNPSVPLYGLRHGTNVIRFKAQSATTLKETPVYTLNFKVRKPVGEKILLAGVILAAIATCILLWVRKIKNKEAAQANYEKKLQEEINRNNMDFFANISHEFRTPLTLISGAADALFDDQSPTDEQKRLANVMKRNCYRMLKLVNQLLDFNKLDKDMLKLNVDLADVADLILRVTDTFEVGARLKNIDLQVDGCDNPFLSWIDSDKIEKCLYNLISNAMKFTPAGGLIEVALKQTGLEEAARCAGKELTSDEMDWLMIEVSDNGVGIPEEKLEYIFQRFAQMERNRHSGGTGIGLSYTRSLVELHHGTIRAYNRTSGDSGAVFRMFLPMSKASYPEEERTGIQEDQMLAQNVEFRNEHEVAVKESTDESRPTVMIIDDNYEFVYYMKSLLSKTYNVVFRFDAMSGYQALEKTKVDVIISDVMMDEVDGLKLCRMVKDNLSYSHIPFILLTAKSTMKDQIEGLNVGADAYLVKPFNQEYLTALISSMIDNRKRIQKILVTSTTSENITEEDMSPADKAFIDELYDQMEQALEDGELNVDLIAEKLLISRTKFYYKVKEITGKTPNEFFTTYKLNRSLELLKSGKYKVSAIANAVGFSSPSHFSTVFKKHFGVFPSQYLQENQ